MRFLLVLLLVICIGSSLASSSPSSTANQPFTFQRRPITLIGDEPHISIEEELEYLKLNPNFNFNLHLDEIQDFIPPPPPPKYKTKYFDQTLDHFNFHTQPATYRQRYLWADDFWNGTYPNGCKGPIFFYAGNEAPVTVYYQASGLFTQVLGPKHHGLLVFAEHRYFGESMPFGNRSWDADKIGYLSTEQALADYANLLTYIKKTTPGAENCPVISFGGSYGGMLSAWFRAKYPNIVLGSLAASAVFAFVGTGVPPDAFTLAATHTFATARDGCAPLIKQAFEALLELSTTQSGRDTFAKAFQLCGPLNSVEEAFAVITWAGMGLGEMAMLDYPYPTNYGVSLPGWPVNKTCDRMISSFKSANPQDNAALAKALGYAIGIFYNNTGDHTCYNITRDVPLLGACCGWQYLACTEMFIPIGSGGMFPSKPFNLTASIEACRTQFGVTPRPDWGKIEFGGFDFKSTSNIIFSSGLLDPWHTSGITQSLSDSLIAIVIPESAHHFDLRGPNVLDPITVKQARKQEGEIIAKWLADYWQALDRDFV